MRRAAMAARSGTVVRLGELPTKERMRQNGGVIKELEPESPKSRVMILKYRARCECWLDRYKLAGKIDQSEFLAGLRFREAWLIVALHVSGQRSLEYIDCAHSQVTNLAEKASFSQRVITDTFKMLTIAQKLAVIACCGQDEPMRTTARVRTLRRALEAMSRFWKL